MALLRDHGGAKPWTGAWQAATSVSTPITTALRATESVDMRSGIAPRNSATPGEPWPWRTASHQCELRCETGHTRSDRDAPADLGDALAKSVTNPNSTSVPPSTNGNRRSSLDTGARGSSQARKRQPGRILLQRLHSAAETLEALANIRPDFGPSGPEVADQELMLSGRQGTGIAQRLGAGRVARDQADQISSLHTDQVSAIGETATPPQRRYDRDVGDRLPRCTIDRRRAAVVLQRSMVMAGGVQLPSRTSAGGGRGAARCPRVARPGATAASSRPGHPRAARGRCG